LTISETVLVPVAVHVPQVNQDGQDAFEQRGRFLLARVDRLEAQSLKYDCNSVAGYRDESC